MVMKVPVRPTPALRQGAGGEREGAIERGRERGREQLREGGREGGRGRREGGSN